MKWRIRSQILRKKQKMFLRRNMQVTAHLEKQAILYWEERRKTPHTTVLFTWFHWASWNSLTNGELPNTLHRMPCHPWQSMSYYKEEQLQLKATRSDCQIRFSENAYRDVLQQKSFFGSWGIIVWKQNKCQNKSPRKESTSVLTLSSLANVLCPPQTCKYLSIFHHLKPWTESGNVGWSLVHISTKRWNSSTT